MKVAAAIGATLAFAALPVIVLAHAQLVSADPPVGGTLPTTPYTLTATFDEELTPDGSSIVVEGPNGAEVATGTVSAADDKTMTAPLPTLGAGTYTVRWTAVTADDLAVEHGTYTFNVGSSPTSATPAPTPPTGGANGSSNDVVIAMVLAAALIAGVVAFIFIRGRR